MESSTKTSVTMQAHITTSKSKNPNSLLCRYNLIYRKMPPWSIGTSGFAWSPYEEKGERLAETKGVKKNLLEGCGGGVSYFVMCTNFIYS